MSRFKISNKSDPGNIIVISAPSGSGKTSLTRRILKEVPGIRFSVSHTTRFPRVGEREGKEYFFVTEEAFQKMIRQDAFLEYAQVYGNYYGTSKLFIDSQLAGGSDVLLDVDVQGALQIKEMRSEAILILLFPPSFSELEDRLRSRGLDGVRVIAQRLEFARKELEYYKRYQYVIINRELEESRRELKSIILAARCNLVCRKMLAEEIIKTFKGEGK